MAQKKQQQGDSGGARRASDVAPKKVHWLWEKRIPEGDITVIAGRPDQGKGLLAAHVAAQVSRRGDKVLYSAVEDDDGRMTRPRLEAAGANLDNVLLWRFALPTQMDELVSHVIDNGIKLVVMDPFAAHLHGVSRYADSIRKVTTPIAELAQVTGAAFLVIEHALKRITENADPLTAISGGGSGMVAASRAAFLFGTDPKDDDYRVLCSVKSNYGEKPKALRFETDTDELDVVGEIPSLVRKDEVDFSASRLLKTGEPGKGGRKPDKRADAAEWLAKYLHAAGKKVKVQDVKEDAKQHGITSKTLVRAAADMVVKDPPGGGRGCTWKLDPDLEDYMAEQDAQLEEEMGS